MSVQDGLRNLARQEAPAPWGFDVFEQRRARAFARRRAALSGAALSVAVLAVVGVLALVTQPQRAQDELFAVNTAPWQSAAVAEPEVVLPALVDLGQFEITSELEDRIALLDAQLSVARVEQAPAEQVRSIEATRAQMNESLQRVSYAHALLSL